MVSELVDIYDDEYRMIGTLEREKAHATGALHKTTQCWFVDSLSVYFQIRGLKVGFPGLLDVTVGGHVASGEGDESALLREALEEVGVELSPSSLLHLGRSQFTFRRAGVFVREFSEVYMLHASEGFDTFSPNHVELSGIAAIPFTEGSEILGGTRETLEVQTLQLGTASRRKEMKLITKESFVPGILDYFGKVVKIGESFASGGHDINL